MRDGDEGALEAGEEILEPVDGVEIEVVGGLVEQQGLGLAEEGLGEQNADFLAALQLAHLALVKFVRDIEALEEDGGVGSRRCSRPLRRPRLPAPRGACRRRRSARPSRRFCRARPERPTGLCCP